MKERPILFSGEMVRAILSGEKTQTRRPVDKKYVNSEPDKFKLLGQYAHKNGKIAAQWEYKDYFREAHCPFGQPGDRLWVRENWKAMAWPIKDYGCIKSPEDYYPESVWAVYKSDCPIKITGPWKPSIHMPRWASRIMLDITAVRVEQIQDISCEDAIAEGINPNDSEFPVRMMFEDLWQEAYPGSWYMNDWVWVIEFKKVEA